MALASAMKTKIQVGQCYRWNDKVRMVVDYYGCYKQETWWVVEEVMNKCNVEVVSGTYLRAMERPFQNYG